MTQEKGEQRYFPTQEELAILVPKLKEYFQLPERSNERKAVVNQTYEAVKDLNPAHWTSSKIRLWFNNNKNVYSGENQRRIPTLKDNLTESNSTDKEIENTPLVNSPLTSAPLINTPLINAPLINIPNANTPLISHPPDDLPSNVMPMPDIDTTSTSSEIKQYPSTEISSLTDSTTMSLDKFPFEASSMSISHIIPSNSIVQPILSSSESKNLIGSQSNFSSSSLSTSFEPQSDLITPYDDEQQHEDIELPDIPPKTDFDTDKHNLYESLKRMYIAIRKISKLPLEDRLKIQKDAENRMTKIIKTFHDLEINDICSNDDTCACIRTPSTSAPKRQYSIITSSYANEALTSKQDVQYEETSPTVFIPYPSRNRLKASASISKNLSYILRGESTYDRIKPKGRIECASISESGDIAYVYLDEVRHAYVLNFKEIEANTGFFATPSSIFVDDIDSRIYVAGDCRVKSFNISDLSLIETYYISSNVILSSCLTVSHSAGKTDLILGTKGTIAMWDVSVMKPANYGTIKTSNNEAMVSKQNIDTDLVEWSRGRPRDSSYKPEKLIEDITSICPFGDIIAFASKKYQTIHLLDINKKEIVGRLIGHVESITKLLRLDSKTLLSGSKDRTCKCWDINQTMATYHFIRHPKKITTMAYGTFENHLLIFSADKDSIVLGWDYSKKISTFELRLTNLIPIEMRFVPDKKKLVIVGKAEIAIYTFKAD